MRLSGSGEDDLRMFISSVSYFVLILLVVEKFVFEFVFVDVSFEVVGVVVSIFELFNLLFLFVVGVVV